MLNIDLLSEYVNIGQEDVKNIKDKEIILVLGKTGTGKTTLICKLQGHKMVE